MPTSIIRRFQRQYGTKQGKTIFYKTARAQGRDPESFRKLSRPAPKRSAERPAQR